MLDQKRKRIPPLWLIVVFPSVEINVCRRREIVRPTTNTAMPARNNLPTPTNTRTEAANQNRSVTYFN